MEDTMTIADCVVVGSGPVGLAACLEAAANGFSVVCLAPSGTHIQGDGRTTAVMMPGIAMLARYGVWDALKDKTAPLEVLRIADATDRLIRAPFVSFHASETGENAFGYNIRNRDLNDALMGVVEAHDQITRIDAMASAIGYEDGQARVTTSDNRTIICRLVIGADGIHSLVRQSAGLDARSWSHNQTAMVMTFSHGRAHNNMSTEFHTDQGPFTQVPLPGDESSLVWVMSPQDAEARSVLDDDALAGAIEARMSSMLGKVTLTARPQSWPLSSHVPDRFSAARMVLVGHAAHAFPPIGAQGLNLGLRDVEALGDALRAGSYGGAPADPGSDVVTGHYDRARRGDIWLRTGAVDLLNRSLLTGFLPVQMIRASGLSALKHFGPLRSVFMAEGMAPSGRLRDTFFSRLLPKNFSCRERTSRAAEYWRS